MTIPFNEELKVALDFSFIKIGVFLYLYHMICGKLPNFSKT
jgi:hypothetical protein